MRNLGLTLAGGGNRSFYQLGLLEAWGPRLWQRVAGLACVSAGACVATMLLSGRYESARLHWDGLRRGITKNVDWTRMLRGQRIAPHGAIYRSALVHALREGGLERLKATPFPIWMSCSIPPRGVPIGIATWLGLGAYSMEKKLDPNILHPRLGRRLGFREFVADARDCRTPEEVADLVLASSSTPPFTPVGHVHGIALLDGGIVDNVPASVVERERAVQRNLVLLTRPYPAGVTGEHGRRLYLEPSGPVPIERWDYREVAPVDATIELGRADAERYGPVLDAWLARSQPAAAQ
ncbi:MAG TPA: patatin-like phospholipase family protein [Polyangiales bacterium]|nr:patatin-like phospholipase family protein [Polyangiales bacterium]